MLTMQRTRKINQAQRASVALRCLESSALKGGWVPSENIGVFGQIQIIVSSYKLEKVKMKITSVIRSQNLSPVSL